MNNWLLYIDLRPEIADYSAGKIAIAPLADRVAIKLLSSGWDKLTAYPDTLRDHIAHMRNSLTGSEYQERWEPLYDLADEDDVMIETGV